MVLNEKMTWFCAACGSQEIYHATISKYDPLTEEYRFVDHAAGGLSSSETWCAKCVEDSGGDYHGEPTFGLVSEHFAEEGDDDLRVRFRELR